MALFKRGAKSPDLMPPDLQNAEERMKQSDLVNTNVARKKGPSPILLGGGALGLTALALGAWYVLGPKSPPEDDSPPIIARRPPRPDSSMKGAPNGTKVKGATATKTVAPSGLASGSNRTRVATGVIQKTTTSTRTVSGPNGVTSQKTTKTTTKATGTKTIANSRLAPRPGVSTRDVNRIAATRPGQLGQRPSGLPAGAPEFPGAKPNQVPAMVPVKGAPTPMGPPDGMAGLPGREGGRNEVLQAQSVAPAGLKTLWQQGAAAKARGDMPAARRAWMKILSISPGHPGIQEAIDKLKG